MGIHDRDYMNQGSAQEAVAEYEQGVADREYGDFPQRRRKRFRRMVVVFLVLSAIGLLVSFTESIF